MSAWQTTLKGTKVTKGATTTATLADRVGSRSESGAGTVSVSGSVLAIDPCCSPCVFLVYYFRFPAVIYAKWRAREHTLPSPALPPNANPTPSSACSPAAQLAPLMCAQGLWQQQQQRQQWKHFHHLAFAICTPTPLLTTLGAHGERGCHLTSCRVCTAGSLSLSLFFPPLCLPVCLCLYLPGHSVSALAAVCCFVLATVCISRHSFRSVARRV